jgi:hypothetical protein
MAKVPRAPRERGGAVLDDSELSIPAFSPVCTYCTHWRPGGRSCAAFPTKNGIPMAIWLGNNRHLAPYGGEQKLEDGEPILFAPVPGAKVPKDLMEAYEKSRAGREKREG